MRCPYCGGYTFDTNGMCKNCGHSQPTYPQTPPFSGYVNPFYLANLLKQRREDERRQKISSIGLRVCDKCQTKALFYNAINDVFECLQCQHVLAPDTQEYKRLVGD